MSYSIRNQHQPHKPPNRKNTQTRMAIEAGLLRTWDLHKSVVLGAHHQENTRKKAEEGKDDFYFQEGNGQKNVKLNRGRLPHWEGPQDCGKCQLVQLRSGNTLVGRFGPHSSVLLMGRGWKWLLKFGDHFTFSIPPLCLVLFCFFSFQSLSPLALIHDQRCSKQSILPLQIRALSCALRQIIFPFFKCI